MSSSLGRPGPARGSSRGFRHLAASAPLDPPRPPLGWHPRAPLGTPAPPPWATLAGRGGGSTTPSPWVGCGGVQALTGLPPRPPSAPPLGQPTRPGEGATQRAPPTRGDPRPLLGRSPDGPAGVQGGEVKGEGMILSAREARTENFYLKAYATAAKREPQQHFGKIINISLYREQNSSGCPKGCPEGVRGWARAGSQNRPPNSGQV